jgi:hydroxypyruvate isomerase
VSSTVASIAYAPNVSWLFPELPFALRPKAVADLGFEAIEFGFPSHADLEALDACRQEHGTRIVLFNQDVPVWDAANRGYLVDPKRRAEFERTLDQALSMATRLGVQKIMLPAGVELPGMDRGAQRERMLENLRAAAPQAAQAGVLLTIEVLNPEDNPGYFLTSSAEAIDIVRQVDHPNVRFQMDTYHLQRMEGHLLETLRANIEWIGHLQFADEPGRHEPGTGAIDFAALVAAAETLGYGGYIGLEYIPRAPGAEALAWVPPERRAPRRGQTAVEIIMKKESSR